MKQGKGILLFLIGGGMEICWLYSWAVFSMSLVMGRFFPFWGAICIFAFAAIITRFSAGKGWMIIHLAGLHVLCFVSAALCIVYTLFYSIYPAFSMDWIISLFRGSKMPLEWVSLIFTLAWTVLLWTCGAALSKRPQGYNGFCARFDIGLAAFFCLFTAKLVLLVKGGVKVDEQVTSVFIFPFFLLGLLAIGMTKAAHKGPKSFLPGYHTIGILTTFSAAVVISAGSVTLFFLPGMKAAAGVGYSALKTGAYSALPFVERFLHFIFARKNPPRAETSNSALGYAWDSLSVKGSWWMDLMEKILGWGIKGAAILMIFLVLAIIVFYGIKWLFSRTDVSQADVEQPGNSKPWFMYIWNVLVSYCRRIVRSIKGYSKAAEIYSVLLRWGSYSGLAYVVSETPLEFGARLKRRFPRLRREIDLIINAFNEEIFGAKTLSTQGLTEIRSSWRTLRSPMHWPVRMKARFLNNTMK